MRADKKYQIHKMPTEVSPKRPPKLNARDIVNEARMESLQQDLVSPKQKKHVKNQRDKLDMKTEVRKPSSPKKRQSVPPPQHLYDN